MPQLAPERVFVLERCFMGVKVVDVVKQTFTASCYIEMRSVGSRNDSDYYKLDEQGKLVNTMTTGGEQWKVVPSILWYLENQLHFPNAWSHEIKECKVLPAKNNRDDLTCIIRVEGEFQEQMELEKFPVDMQDLQLHFEIQCAKGTSPFPVKFTVSPNLIATVDEDGFNLRNVWDISTKLSVTCWEHKGIGTSTSANYYPAVNVSARVFRHSAFYVYNVAIPMALFSLFAVLVPLAISREDTGDRLGVALTLVLTAAAYKFSIAQLVPTVSYLTLLDLYVLEQAAIIALVTIQNCIVGLEAGPIQEISPGFTINAEADFATLMVILVLWVLSQVKSVVVWTGNARDRARLEDDDAAAFAEHVDTPPREAGDAPAAGAAAGEGAQAASKTANVLVNPKSETRA